MTKQPGRAAAALIGLLAVAAALGVGELVAGLLLAPQASPFLAVGNAAIDRTPGPVKDFAIANFGSNDKIVLLLSMAVVIALVGLAAGLGSRRRLLHGLAVVVVLGLVGIAAVAEQAGGGLALLAPVAALLVGVAAFAGLYAPARRRAAERPDNDSPGVLRRRGFLVGSTGVAAGVALAGTGGYLLSGRVDVEASRRAVGTLVPAVAAPPIPPGADFAEIGTPTFITPNSDFYRVDINLAVPRLRAEDTRLRITGLVDREMELSFDDIRDRPLVEKTVTMTCLSNFVGGHYVSTSNFIGVPLADLLAEAGVRAEATQLVGRSADGFTIGTPLRWVLDPATDAMLVIGMNREPLLAEHGFPMRTVVAGLYGYVSATKWLTELELTTFEFDPYWEQRGWDGGPEGIVPIKTASRIDTPAGFAQVPAGEVDIAGVAWAQTRGIERVEISVDGGPWQPTELAVEVNLNTWRMWRARSRLAPGLHSVSVRAADKTGNVQTAERVPSSNPGPDGATGQQTVTFTVV
jgi:DMSO/TMAO reductase YedYZ molybdopterin-dependent catalytic subunit